MAKGFYRIVARLLEGKLAKNLHKHFLARTLGEEEDARITLPPNYAGSKMPKTLGTAILALTDIFTYYKDMHEDMLKIRVGLRKLPKHQTLTMTETEQDPPTSTSGRTALWPLLCREVRYRQVSTPEQT